eukprot:365763-Chlamydomonas_euryale.AAC.30
MPAQHMVAEKRSMRLGLPCALQDANAYKFADVLGSCTRAAAYQRQYVGCRTAPAHMHPDRPAMLTSSARYPFCPPPPPPPHPTTYSRMLPAVMTGVRPKMISKSVENATVMTHDRTTLHLNVTLLRELRLLRKSSRLIMSAPPNAAGGIAASTSGTCECMCRQQITSSS